MVNVAALDCLQHIMMTDGYQDGVQQYDLCCHSNHIHSHVALTTWVRSVDANGRSIPQNCLASDQGLAAADDSNAHDDSQQLETGQSPIVELYVGTLIKPVDQWSMAIWWAFQEMMLECVGNVLVDIKLHMHVDLLISKDNLIQASFNPQNA